MQKWEAVETFLYVCKFLQGENSSFMTPIRPGEDHLSSGCGFRA